MDCPRCKATSLDRDSIDNGVRILYGPYGCQACGWSEEAIYDIQNPEKQPNTDCYGGYYPVKAPNND